ncbi:hypothetical protein [Massilia aquatica]|uniref:hypothetical protein n=1 Tax=Massilia aquatica TaxID=2609000 RepID=UPI0016524F75|nr:hypothetical protein [Massilia aquatica]
MDSKIASAERHEFCERLIAAVVKAGCTPSPTAFAREFNLRADGAAVTVHAARKWLVGDAFPTQERLHVLARWLNVSPQWLRFGESSEGTRFAANDTTMIPHDEVVLLGDFRRLDERSQAVVRDVIASLLRHNSLRS